VKKSLEITAVTGAILCVLRAFDFFQQIKLRHPVFSKRKVPRVLRGTFFAL
jgi:hypothetical protein